MTASPSELSTRSESDRPSITASRDMGSDRNRSMMPVDMSCANPTAVEPIVPNIVIANMPGMRNSR